MTTIFGIRHHGPGCARSLARALEVLQPDVILIELPADLESQLQYVADEEMKPPVALMVYPTDQPDQASFYPFAEFSPEWQAFQWASRHQVTCRGFDLPTYHMIPARYPEEEEETSALESNEVTEEFDCEDPFDAFARADGYSDGERWWNDRVEERDNDTGLFLAINEAVTVMRQELGRPESKLTLLREAWMRKCMRAAEKEGFRNIAVICGAWHVPALQEKISASQDNELLKGLAKVKTDNTWIPWTFERLSTHSGYGAGVRAPGWYAHLWQQRSDPMPSWITKAGRILRKEGQEASSASIIEAIRLANALAGMRGRPKPGLDESMEAMQTVFCMGETLPLSYLRNSLLIGTAMGKLPASMPKLPLQADIEATCRSLRLKFAASVETLELDLREEGSRKRSVFLHRLQALGVNWGKKQYARSKGTFKEQWSLAWTPQLEVAIISAAPFGNTLESAAQQFLLAKLPSTADLPHIAKQLDLAVLAQLPNAVTTLLQRLDAAAAHASAVTELLDAVPPLAQTARYGDVRKSSVDDLEKVISGFTARIHASLVAATYGLQEDAAETLAQSIYEYNSALRLLEHQALIDEFHLVLQKIMQSGSAHATLRGQATRLLHDANAISDEIVSLQFSFALSAGMDPLASGCWLEGFLRGSGSMLLHDRTLLANVDEWLAGLSDDAFQSILPMLRRTFGSFTVPERTRIASAVQQPQLLGKSPVTQSLDIDLARALPAARAVAQLLTISTP